MKSSEEIVEKLEKEIIVFRGNASQAALVDKDTRIASYVAIAFAQGMIDWIKSDDEKETEIKERGMIIECPVCKCDNLSVERRPNGNAVCMSCGWKGAYAHCFTINRNDRIEKLEEALNCCKNDYWFMINLLEKYSYDKDQAIKDCVERMKFRKPLFNILDKIKDEEKETETKKEG